MRLLNFVKKPSPKRDPDIPAIDDAEDKSIAVLTDLEELDEFLDGFDEPLEDFEEEGLLEDIELFLEEEEGFPLREEELLLLFKVFSISEFNKSFKVLSTTSFSFVSV